MWRRLTAGLPWEEARPIIDSLSFLIDALTIIDDQYRERTEELNETQREVAAAADALADEHPGMPLDRIKTIFATLLASHREKRPSISAMAKQMHF